MHLQSLSPKEGRISLTNLVIIIDLKWRPATYAVLAVAAAPYLLHPSVTYMY